MKNRYFYAAGLFIIFFGLLFIAVIFSEKDGKQVRDSVLRFHVVANSDSEYDQQNKMSVRDGIAELCSELFGNAPDKQSAMNTAMENSDIIAECAENILRLNGSDDKVNVTVRKRFFPTRKYDGVSLPAGVYDTVDVTIGQAAGKNFWCVMFPDICINASNADMNRQKMSDVLSDSALEMATDADSPSVKFKFKTVEIFQSVKNFLFR